MPGLIPNECGIVLGVFFLFGLVLVEAGANGPVDHVFGRHPEFAGASLEQPGQIVVDGERGAHVSHHAARESDVNTSPVSEGEQSAA
jgi:hypothetical protein